MDGYISDKTYPIPHYWPRWFYRLYQDCPECDRLDGQRDNVFDSRAQSEFGRPNIIKCRLCGVEYYWARKGCSHEGPCWGSNS